MEMMTAFGEIKQSKCYTNNLGDVKIIGYCGQASSDGCLENGEYSQRMERCTG